MLKIKKQNLKWLIAAGVILLTGALAYFLWLRPTMRQPIGAQLTLPTPVQQAEQPAPPANLAAAPIYTPPTPAPDAKPICGNEDQWLVLLVGIDYRGDGYLYGLADVIRLARIDFVEMTMDMVALPRDLLVEAPEGRFTAPDPYKINQAYLFGTPDMGHFAGEGEGAGALAEVIYYNFGLPIDHYAVINFETFVNAIDAIGGVTVDLPAPAYDENLGSFSAGEQTLTGQRALALARIRSGIGDAGRVNHQTLVMRAALNQLVKPRNLVRLPGLLRDFSGAFLTDLSLEQSLRIGTCFLRNFDTKNLGTHHPPKELLQAGSHFIPTLNNNAFVYTWDEALVEWVYAALLGE